MDRTKFERLVGEAVDGLPKFFQERLQNVAIAVEDYPGPEVRGQFSGKILGLYHGIPRPRRSVWAQPPAPDIIYIYQRNIEAVCRTEKEIREQVQATVIHEIGHYFGLSDADIERLQREG